jgi:hypothetical protein
MPTACAGCRVAASMAVTTEHAENKMGKLNRIISCISSHNLVQLIYNYYSIFCMAMKLSILIAEHLLFIQVRFSGNTGQMGQRWHQTSMQIYIFLWKGE